MIVLPWSEFWERNYFAQNWPLLAPIITNAFVRGAVTGLGFVNLLAGVADLAPILTSRADRLDTPANSQAEP